MKKKLFGAVVLAAALCVAAGCAPQEQQGGSLSEGKQPGGDSFEYEGNYTAPELTIDGLDTDAQWQSAPVLATFGRNDAATVKVYRGAEALFFYFTVSDTVLLTEGEANDDTVTRSDSVELYLDTLADGGSRPQSDDYQINLGIHGKTRIMQGAGSQWGNWNGLIDYEVSLDGTLNDGTAASDTGYSVEVMVPYSQIGIERTDTIGVSFAQVDKWGAGASSGTDWDWFGWTFEGTLREPQTPDNYVLLDAENNLTDRDAQEMPPADMAGYVRDNATGDPIVGATASVVIDGEKRTATTDSQGYFVFADVDSDATYTIIITMDGYLEGNATYSRSELRAAEGGAVTKNITLRDAASVVRTDIKGTVENIVNGTVAGAIVTVAGVTENGQPLSATTDENGAFTIERVPADVDVTLLVSKAGYGDSRTYLAQEDLTGDGTTEAGDVNLNLPYGETGPFGLTTQLHAENTMQVSRTLTGVEMLFSGKRAFTGNIELFIDTKASTGNRDEEETAWRLDLHADGTIGGTHFAGGALTVSGLDWQIFENGENGYEARLFLPYTWLDIEPLEVFGISLGQLPDGASWDGWGFEGVFIDPASTVNYVRVSALNRLYRAESNEAMVTLSGNAGQAGVLVQVGETTTTSGTDGAWSMSYSVADTSQAITVTYSKQGYVSQSETIAAEYFDTHIAWTGSSITLSEQTVSISGKVTNRSTGAGIGGVTVTLTGTGINKSMTTSADGEYAFDGVTTYVDVTITFTCDGYATSEDTVTAQTLASYAADGYVLNKQLTRTSDIQIITVTGKVVDISGNGIAGATVSVGGTQLTATTQTDGTFSIANFEGIDSTLTISAQGYLPQTVTFSADSLEQDAQSYVFADTLLPLDYVAMGDTIGTKYASFTGNVTRSATGFEFRFVAANEFTGTLELFVDTGLSTLECDASDYRFDLRADGTLGITNFGTGSNNAAPATMRYTIATEDEKTVLYFTLPYAFLDVQQTDIIGVSAGQSVNADWDGWGVDGMEGVDGLAFVAPEIPADYLRIGVDNKLFENTANVTTETLDLNEYQMIFGLSGDVFHAKITRGTDGVTFELATLGDFGTASVGNKELILIYFDTGASSNTNNWASDYLIKIDSDGKVYGNNAAWYKTIDGGFQIGTISITREGGVTKFSYTVSYTTLGIGASDIFGISFAEGWHKENDNAAYAYDDCKLKASTGLISVGDGAVTANFIRVAADGTLYDADNNDPVTGEE